MSAPDVAAFDDAAARDAALGAAIVAALGRAVADRGAGLLLASGGSTPRALYERLARAELDWARVAVALVDERRVPLSDPASNEAMIRTAFAPALSKGAQVVGMQGDPDAVEARYAPLSWPADVCLLGMGGDGHTASWFPHATGLAAALSEAVPPYTAAVRAKPSAVTGAVVDRITVTYGAVATARRVDLMIAGAEKRAAFEAAAGAGEIDAMPVRAVLRSSSIDMTVWWCP